LFLTIAHLQYSTLQARATQAGIEANQVSTRAKNAPVVAESNGAEVRYELVSVTP
jgi:hypothetical protein